MSKQARGRNADAAKLIVCLLFFARYAAQYVCTAMQIPEKATG
jgi:hypothetical protein